nr:classD [uncultured bacterium]
MSLSDKEGNQIMKWLLTLCLLLLGGSLHAAEWQESAKVAELFKKAGVEGTFVLYDVKADRMTGYNQMRAQTRLVPASTFKIPNSLIGLSTGTVKSVDEVLPYGGKPQPYPQWERDMGLRDAIVMSNVPIYQELARRIGLEQMQQGVTKLGYGNQQIGTIVDRFWLDGPLKISAIEQAQFLAKLAQGTLPLDADVQKTVREIVQLEKNDQWTLYGKTGWENAPGAGTGWWVGWVEKDGRVYSFALNVAVRVKEDGDKRVPLGKESLQALGVL